MKKFLAFFLLVLPVLANAQFTPGQLLTAAELNHQFALYAPLGGATFTGSLNSSLTTSGSVAGPVIDNLFTCTDTQTIASGILIKDCQKFLQQYGGSTVTGNRQAVEGYGLLTAPSQGGSIFRPRYYVGGSFTQEAQTSDNGFATTLNASYTSGGTTLSVASASGIVIGTTLNVTLSSPVNGSSVQQTVVQNVAGTTLTISPTLNANANNGAAVVVSLGELQGSIHQAVTDSGANYFDALVGLEANITAIGLAPRIKTWLGVGNNSNDAVAGTQWDAAIGVTSASSSLHAKTGILFAPYAGFFPVNTTGALIGAYTGASQTSPINVFDGFDFSGINLTNSVLRGQVNSTAVASSTTNPGLALQDNVSGGSAEINLVNTFQSASNTLTVLQKTGASSFNTVFSVGPTGNASVAGTFGATSGNFTGNLGVALSGAAINLNDTSGASFSQFNYLNNGSKYWALSNNSSGNTISLNRFNAGAFVDSPLSISNSTGNVTFADAIIPSQTAGIIGTNTNNNVNAGSVGELISSTVANNGVSLPIAGTVTNITSISLTAGDWDVSGSVQMSSSAQIMTNAFGGVSTTSATLGGPGTYAQIALGTAGNLNAAVMAVPVSRLSLSGTTTVYLVGSATAASGTTSGGGVIRARRIR